MKFYDSPSQSQSSVEFYQRLTIPIDTDDGCDYDTKMQYHILECINALIRSQKARAKSQKVISACHSSRSAVFWKFLSEITREISSTSPEEDLDTSLSMSLNIVQQSKSPSDAFDMIHLQLASACACTTEHEISLIGKENVKKAHAYFSSNSNIVTPYHLAAKVCDPNMEIIRRLNNFFPRMGSFKDEKGWLPLHYAARYSNSVAMIQELLEDYPAGSSVKTLSGETPLQLVCSNSCSEAPSILRMLVAIDAKSVKIPKNDGRLPFHEVVTSNKLKTEQQIEMFSILLSVHPEGVCVSDDRGKSCVFYTCELESQGAETLMEMIIKACPRAPQVLDLKGVLPLHRVRSLEVAKLLVAAYPQGLALNDETFRTPLHQAACRNNVEVVKYLYSCRPESLREYADDWTPLHFSAFFSESKIVLEEVYNLDPSAIMATTAHGNTPLHTIAKSKKMNDINISQFRFLLSKYPEAAKLKNQDGLTPYALYKRRGGSDFICRLLLRAAPHINPEELKCYNYAERRMAMFLFFVGVHYEGKLTLFTRLRKVSKDHELIRRVIEYL